MSFEARDLTVKLFSVEHDGLWAMPCGACDSTAAAPKPGCPPPSKPCNPTKPACPPPSKKAHTPDLRAAEILALRQQLQSALSTGG